MNDKKIPAQIAVLGLGRFGQSLVQSLAGYNVDILACDKNEEPLHAVANFAKQVVQADAADEEAMEKIGIGNFDVVVMAMGEDILSSILATTTAKQQGAKYIVVKAFGHREKQVLQKVGADLVVVPEQEMGVKLAHRLMRPNVVDVLDGFENFEITEMKPLAEWVGKTIKESDIRRRHRTSILAIVRSDKTIAPVMPEEVIQKDDLIIAVCE